MMSLSRYSAVPTLSGRWSITRAFSALVALVKPPSATLTSFTRSPQRSTSGASAAASFVRM